MQTGANKNMHLVALWEMYCKIQLSLELDPYQGLTITLFELFFCL